jgi:hypothetical protein
MAEIELRVKTGERDPADLKLTVQDRTFDHLMSTISTEVRISAFLDRDVARVEAEYAEVFVSDDCRFNTRITKVIPGSRSRKGIVLPGPMTNGEQLTILVARSPKG